jgi:dTDP-4-amino-4,6-dideoxygalactose transaminase
MSRVYLSPPDVGAVEREMLLEAFDSNWIAPTGPDLGLFEHEIAEQVGVAHAVALSSGTAALHLALLLAGVGKGDEVIVPSLTFVASAAAVTYLGAEPIFVDCSLSSWNLDPGLVEEVLVKKAATGHRPAAVVTVDLYGEAADYAELERVCRRFDVPLIEDSAEALGATYNSRAAGSFGVAGVFSFNGNKIITTSGGGILVTNSPGIATQARSLASQAREPLPHYEHSVVGYNYRLSNLLAALGRAQLRGLEWRIARRKKINEAYVAGLADAPGISFMPHTPEGTPNYWLTCILIDPGEAGTDRERVRLALEAEDVESRPTWKPLHLQPAFSGSTFVGAGHCAQVFDDGLCLPSGSSLSSRDQTRVIEIVHTQLCGSGQRSPA